MYYKKYRNQEIRDEIVPQTNPLCGTLGKPIKNNFAVIISKWNRKKMLTLALALLFSKHLRRDYCSYI